MDPPVNSDEQRPPPGPLSADSDAKVQYVLSGQPTGWVSIAANVREYDEAKVKDTKEDIDTLLVFAGLFSAVLTAFLVEAYQRLSPDTSSQMLSIMQQMSLQMASFNGPEGTVNSTYQPTVTLSMIDLQPFEPSPTDICINILWFASLIFSLVTASFGMLVKQWLREYLADMNPSPHARLRIRHYRWPGLVQWKVFEIAAILPLLQQLALALFFIGLCYFTASVHESVGHTTLPLVAGWAFCFSLVTILPAFFPRCPYRTTPLRALFRAINIYLMHLVRHMMQRWHLDNRLKYVGWRREWLFRYRRFLDRHFSKHNEILILTTDEADLDILAEIDALQSNDELLRTTIFESLRQIHNPGWNEVMKLVFKLLEHRIPISADGSLLSKLPEPMYLRTLSPSAYMGIINIISHYFEQYVLSSLQSSDGLNKPKPYHQLTQRALYILFSPARIPLPNVGINLLVRIFRHQDTALIRMLVSGCLKYTDPSSQLRLLLQGMKQRAEDLRWPIASSLRYLETIIDTVFQTTHSDSTPLPADSFVLDGDVEAWPWANALTSPTICYDATEFTAELVRRILRDADSNFDCNDCSRSALSPVDDDTIKGKFVGAIACMWLLANKARKTPGLYWFSSAVGDCLSQMGGTVALLSALSKTSDSVVVSVCTQLIKHSSLALDVTKQMLRNLSDALDDLTNGGQVQLTSNSNNDIVPCGITHSLRIMCFIVHLSQLPNAFRQADQWKTLCDATTRLIYKALGVQNVQTSPTRASIPILVTAMQPLLANPPLKLIGACLDHVQQQDLKKCSASTISEARYQDWLTIFQDSDAIIDDTLVEILGVAYFASLPADQRSWTQHDIPYYRLEKLDLKKKVDDVPGPSLLPS